MDVLARLVESTRDRVARGRRRWSMASLQAAAGDAPAPRPFVAAVTVAARSRPPAVIAEVKRRSPSGGLMRAEFASPAGFDPADIAQRYVAGGAAAISCLTEPTQFAGRLAHIRRIKAAVDVPVLRKDFLVDPWQIWQSRVAHADAVLLIAECLDDPLLSDMVSLARELSLGVLLEVHRPDHLPRAIALAGDGCLVGINNRDLRSQSVNVSHTLGLAGQLADRSRLVSESGIRTAQDLRRLRSAGVRIVLVGESLLRQPDPGLALQRLLTGVDRPDQADDDNLSPAGG